VAENCGRREYQQPATHNQRPSFALPLVFMYIATLVMRISVGS
jgi:hypothetical protein